MSKNMAEAEGPQTTAQYGAYALHAGQVRLYAREHGYVPRHSHTHTNV
jgi:hypothetical protein